jgi:hypothetical protein
MDLRIPAADRQAAPADHWSRTLAHEDPHADLKELTARIHAIRDSL